MYRYSPIRNHRSKGIKTKHVVQLCLLVAVCFWLIFQVKRSHDKKKEFDANISLNTRAAETDHEIVKFGRKDLQPKLEETTTRIEDAQEDEDDQDENKHEDEDKIEEKDDGGGGGDDEIDEKSNVEIDRDEVDIIDEDKETEESEEKETEEKDDQSQTENTVEQEKSNMEFDRDEVDIVDEDKVNEESEEKDGQSQTENTEIEREEVDIVDEDVKATEEKDGQSQTDENKGEQEKSNIEIDHDEVDIVDEDKATEESEGKDGQSQTENRVEDGSTEHTHEAREEHYKADDASSAVLTHDPENEMKNGTLSDGSITDVGLVENGSPPNTTTTYVTETTPNLTQMLNIEENTSDESRHLDN